MDATSRTRLFKLLGLVAILSVGGWLAARALAPHSAPVTCDALARRGIVQVYASDEVSLRCEGVRVMSLAGEVARGLEADDAEPLVLALRAHKGSAVALAPNTQARGVGKRLAARAFVFGLRAVVLSPELAVYAPVREPSLPLAQRDALAYVARALFRGAREPNVGSFPPALRRVERVEVMVTLSRNGEPRLWRSARGTSIARALLTATRVARDRWREREQAMGGPLDKRLLELDVEVALLSEDGTLAATQGAFIDAAVTPEHGIGFDRRTAWHYVLPQDVPKRNGPFAALSGQLRELGLSPSVLTESDTRVYRFVTIPLGVSKAPLSSAQAP